MIDEVDWRIKIAAKLAEDTLIKETGQVAEKGAIVKVISLIKLNKKKTLSIPVPELTALYISASKSAWDEYRKIRNQNNIDSSLKSEVTFSLDENAFDSIENLSISIIMAYCALEAFCNDAIPEDHEYWHTQKSDIILERSNKSDLERYFSTGYKIDVILPSVFEVESPKGKKAWQSYKKLKECRDALVHAKSSETRSVGLDDKNLWNKLFVIEKPYLLAKDIFSWFLRSKESLPVWFQKYPS